MFRTFWAILFATLCLTVVAQQAVLQRLAPDQEATALRSAERIGMEIYRHDGAAWVATDAVLGLPGFKDDKRHAGWITQEKQGQIVVTFIDKTPSALYRVVVSSEGVAGPAVALEPPAPLSDYELGAAQAFVAATSVKIKRCADKYNPVVLPASDAAPNHWVVYLMPASTKKNVVPLGGSYRVEVNGAEVSSQRGFTNSCITLSTDFEGAAASSVPAGSKPVAMTVTHLLDAVPTEAHVFWSLWAKMPMYVSIAPHGSLWLVNGNNIKLVQRNIGTQ